MTRPVLPKAQSLIHSAFALVVMICLQVVYETRIFWLFLRLTLLSKCIRSFIAFDLAVTWNPLNSYFIIILANYPFNFERKKRFSVTILNFFDQTGSRYFETYIFFTNYLKLENFPFEI